MRLTLKQSEFIHESEIESFFRILTDPRKEVFDFHIISKDIIQLEWSPVRARGGLSRECVLRIPSVIVKGD